MNGVIAAARSFLFVPGDRPERLPKALASGAHAVIFDLEDAVAAPDKARARRAFAQALPTLEDRSRVLVRINAAGSESHEDDVALLTRIVPYRIAGVVLAKAEDAHAIERVARLSTLAVVPLIESVEGLHHVDSLARARGVARLAFGHLDFQLDLAMQAGGDERELDAVRLAIAMASRRAGLPAPVDGVTTALEDAARLAADAERSKRLGFCAKLCIHPKQVNAVNAAFAPSDAQVAWARRVLDAAKGAEGGAFRLDGQMVDAPVLRRAQSLLDACLDVAEVTKRLALLRDPPDRAEHPARTACVAPAGDVR